MKGPSFAIVAKAKKVFLQLEREARKEMEDREEMETKVKEDFACEIVREELAAPTGSKKLNRNC